MGVQLYVSCRPVSLCVQIVKVGVVTLSPPQPLGLMLKGKGGGRLMIKVKSRPIGIPIPMASVNDLFINSLSFRKYITKSHLIKQCIDLFCNFMSTGGRDQENGKTWKQAGLAITLGNHSYSGYGTEVTKSNVGCLLKYKCHYLFNDNITVTS